MLSSLIATGMLFSQNSQDLFAETFGGASDDCAWSIIQTTDGGYALAGRTSSSGAGADDFLVLKLTSSGGLDWAKTFGGTGIEDARSIVQTTDGGYAIAGWTTSFGAGGADLLVLKLTSSGGLVWAKTFGGASDDYAYSIVQTTDGGYAVAGSISSSGAGSFDLFVLKLTSAGDRVWAKTFGGMNWDEALSIVQTTDGGYAVAGKTMSYGAGNYDLFVLKLTSSGGLDWAKTFGGTSGEDAYSIVQTTDGGYAIAGSTSSFSAGGLDLLVLKLTSSGGLDWVKTFGGTSGDYARYILQTTDGGYAVAGGTMSYSAGSYDLFVLKLTSSGGLDWAKTFGGTGYEYAWPVVQTTDGGYAVVGETMGFGAGGYDLVILKTGSDGSYSGCVSDCTPTVGTPSPSTSSPSPTTSSPSVGANCTPTVGTPTLTVTNVCQPVYEDVDEGLGKGLEFSAMDKGIYLFMPKEAQVSLTLYDAQGRLVQNLYDGILTSGGHTFSPKLEAKGVYLAVLRHQGGMESLKIVK